MNARPTRDRSDGDRTLPVLITMGVSGSGKTTLGKALAQRLEVPFEEGDELHPARNIAKMRRGEPLDDADRAPWLDRIAAWIGTHGAAGGIVSCSALKKAYRDRLRASGVPVRFVLLAVGRATLQQRVAHRPGHFMPDSLLESQLDTLEPPRQEPDVLSIDGAAPVDRNVAVVLRWLGCPGQP